jgi:YHS domain-containing protein
METSRRLWVLAVVLGVGGCAYEDASTPPVTAPLSKAPASSSGGGGTPPVAAPGKQLTAPAAPTATRGEAKNADAPPLEPPKTGAAKGVALTEAQIAKIKTLPAAEQDAALKQAVCPISGDHLGTMGTPFKIALEGRTVYLCCDGCEDKAKQDPKAVLATLDKR